MHNWSIDALAKIKAIQERLGHSKMATTMDTYAHVIDELQEETKTYFEKLADG